MKPAADQGRRMIWPAGLVVGSSDVPIGKRRCASVSVPAWLNSVCPGSVRRELYSIRVGARIARPHEFGSAKIAPVGRWSHSVDTCIRTARLHSFGSWRGILASMNGRLDMYTPHSPETLAAWGLCPPHVRHVGFLPPKVMAEQLGASADALFLPASFELLETRGCCDSLPKQTNRLHGDWTADTDLGT